MVDAASVTALLPVPPRMLALGEPVHGEGTLLDLRNGLFRQLVEREGYRTVAIESDCLLAGIVDDYVRTGDGDLDDVMERGFSHPWFNASAGNRDLVRWMRSHNEARPPAEHVRFAGFDGPLEMTGAQSPRHALLALHASLADRGDPLPCTAGDLDDLLGADDRWTDPGAMRDPSRSVGRSPEADRLRLLADDLVTLLHAQLPVSPEDDLYARTATGLLRYHRWLADDSPARLTRLVTVRAAMMAANLLALAGEGPTLVHAHNGHLQRARSTMRMGGQEVAWWGAGALVADRLGERYAFLATAIGTLRHHGVDAPPPDTVEGLLYARPGDSFVVDARSVTGPGLVPRASPYHGYSALDPAGLPTTDAVVFVRDVAPR
jgi:erythromycin esterase-like protein